MGEVVHIVCLLFIAISVSSSCAEKFSREEIQQSHLLMEYNWPEPSKNLKRIPHPKSCHHFYHIRMDGSHVIKKCHGGEIFDYQSLRCKKGSSAKCWKNIVIKGNMKKVKRHFSCPFPWGLYPDTEDCSQFYDCLGGKVYPRKCPVSTLFDRVDRNCVHYTKATCAEDLAGKHRKDGFGSHRKDVIGNKADKFEGHGRHGEREMEKKGKEGHNKSNMLADIVKDDRSTRNTSLQSLSAVKMLKNAHENTHARGSYKDGVERNTLKADSEENSSEEINSSEEKYRPYRTKSKNRFTTAVTKPKSHRTPSTDSDESSSEENSSEERRDRFSTKSKPKLTSAKHLTSSAVVFDKKNITEIHPTFTINFSEVSVESSSGSENEVKSIIDTTISEGIGDSMATSKQEDNTNNGEQVTTNAEEKLMELTSASESLDHKKAIFTTESRYISNSNTLDTKTPESPNPTEKFNVSCPDSHGTFPHPKDRSKYVVCVGHKPIIMECPKSLVYDSNTASCNYDKI